MMREPGYLAQLSLLRQKVTALKLRVKSIAPRDVELSLDEIKAPYQGALSVC
jgi:hypothetical protein